MSVDIKDANEKKIIIAYLKCIGKNKGKYYGFCNNIIYHKWVSIWPEDWKKDVNGRVFKIYDNKFILSKDKYKKGINPPDYYDEYTEYLSEITKWINENYDAKILRMKRNSKRYYIPIDWSAVNN